MESLLHKIWSFVDTVFFQFLNQFEASYTKEVLDESVSLIGMLWPYLVAGIVVTTILKLFISRKRLAGFFINRKYSSIVVASVIGVISPLGSYIVIPVSAGLFSIGVPIPVLMALLISSPLINPNLFLLTAGAFGMEMAVMRTISAFSLGILAGYGTLALTRWRMIPSEGLMKNNSGFDFNNSGEAELVTWRSFFNELYKMTRYISKFFFLAILLAATIKILASPNFIIRMFNGNNFLSVLISTGAGVPFYVCGGAAIPVIQQFAALGLDKGAVLAFFISGPVTKLSNILIMHSAFQLKVLFLYVALGVAGAFFMGMVYSWF